MLKNHDHKKLILPVELPEPGFYYHYKHDPSYTREDCADADIRNYAYEVQESFGLYTEEDGPADKFRVEYLPLYPWAYAYGITLEVGRPCRDHRPLSMFVEGVDKPEYTGPRFRRVTDPEIIKRLTTISDEMYGNFPRTQS